MGGIIYYGKYTKDRVERANQIDLEELLRQRGEKLLRSGRELRLESDRGDALQRPGGTDGAFRLGEQGQGQSLPQPADDGAAADDPG